MKMRKILIYGILAFSFLTLFGCGFHLRGKTTLPPQLKVLYIETSTPYTPFMVQLKQMLRRTGVTLVDDPSKAPITLKLSGQHFQQSTFSQSASANTTQYTLKYFYTYEFLDQSGNSYYGPKTLYSQQNYTVNEDSVLSSGNETDLIKDELQRNSVYQFIEQLGSQDLAAALAQPPRPTASTGTDPSSNTDANGVTSQK